MSQHCRVPKYGDYQKQTNNTFVGSSVCAKISIFREQGKHSFFEIRKSLINVQIVQIHILYVFDYDIFGCLLLKLLFQPASYQERGNSYCNFFFNFMPNKPCLKVQILQYKFLNWKCLPPLGTFPKIHPPVPKDFKRSSHLFSNTSEICKR